MKIALKHCGFCGLIMLLLMMSLAKKCEVDVISVM